MKSAFPLILLVLLSCKEPERSFKDIDIQGHRGCRGLMPENSIGGFLKAIDLGVNTLEMDLAISSDSQIIVSHEPYMNHEIATDTTRQAVTKQVEKSLNIFEMTYAEVRKFDIGLKPHPRFPDQLKRAASKPLLSQIIDTVEAITEVRQLSPLNYNIEIKSRIDWDAVYHPYIEDFSDMVYQLLDDKLDWKRVTIQSFDFRVLEYFRGKYPNVQLALLVENNLSWKSNIDSLGFTPEIYSCDYNLLSRSIVGELKTAGMKVIPWTVNEPEDMQKLLEWNVDGIITDYPNRIPK